MKRTILLIEDNEQNRYLTRFLLEGRDCVVVEAENGRLGIELASKQKFDLILLDIQLPIMDGYTVAKELRDNPATRNIPIVAVTSYAMMGDREKALSAGCDGYLEKPINPETFVSEIERFLPQP
jgi:two-component system cell cycle response regulator DivK